jgi:hypothetical protein
LKKKVIAQIDFSSAMDCSGQNAFQSDLRNMLAGGSDDPCREVMEMLSQQTWTYQIDHWRAAGVIHQLLSCSDNALSISKVGGDFTAHPKLSSGLLHSDLWQHLLDGLLNAFPLASLRECLEDALSSDPSQAKRLKSHLCNLNILLLS